MLFLQFLFFFCVLRYLSGDLRLPTLQLENCFIILRTLREKAIFGQMVIVFVPQIKHLNYSLSTGHSRRDWETTEKMIAIWTICWEMPVTLPWEQWKYSPSGFDLFIEINFLMFGGPESSSLSFGYWLTDVRLFERLWPFYCYYYVSVCLALMAPSHWAKKK